MSSPTTICFTVTATPLGWGQMQWGIGPWGEGQERLLSPLELSFGPITSTCFEVVATD